MTDATILEIAQNALPDYDSYRTPAVWPASLVPAQLSINLIASSTSFTNNFSSFQHAAQLGGPEAARWELTATFEGLDETELKTISAFCAKLRGCAKRFLFPGRPGRRPAPAGTAMGGGSDDDSVSVVLQPSAANVLLAGPFYTMAEGQAALKAGDMVSFDTAVERKLCIVTQDAIVQEDGCAELYLEPPLAAWAVEGTALHFVNPSAIFILAPGSEISVTRTPDKSFTVSISAVQARPLIIDVPAGLYVEETPGPGPGQDSEIYELAISYNETYNFFTTQSSAEPFEFYELQYREVGAAQWSDALPAGGTTWYIGYDNGYGFDVLLDSAIKQIEIQVRGSRESVFWPWSATVQSPVAP